MLIFHITQYCWSQNWCVKTIFVIIISLWCRLSRVDIDWIPNMSELNCNWDSSCGLPYTLGVPTTCLCVSANELTTCLLLNARFTLSIHIGGWIHRQALLYGYTSIACIMQHDRTAMNLFTSIRDWDMQICMHISRRKSLPLVSSVSEIQRTLCAILRLLMKDEGDIIHSNQDFALLHKGNISSNSAWDCCC